MLKVGMNHEGENKKKLCFSYFMKAKQEYQYLDFFFFRRKCKPSTHNLFMNFVKTNVTIFAEYPWFLLVSLRNSVGKKMVE